jgi:serine/threonine protein kinase
LKYIHKKQVVHRDLKPDNIMITYRGDDVKIIDFGLADASMYDSLKIMAGTERYSAPELLSGGNVDARADIYSVGVIIEDMISANHLPCYLKRVAAKCCQANPDDRYCDVESLEAAISDRRVQLWQRFLVPLLVIVTTVVLLLSLSSLFKH